MSEEIKARKIRCVEIVVGERNLGIFIETSSWNGILELKRITDDKTLIVMDNPNEQGFGNFFDNLMNQNEPFNTVVLKGSPDLVLDIRNIVDPVPRK